MAKLRPKGQLTLTDGKGNAIVLEEKVAKVQETWINASGGSFNTFPLLSSIGLQPFKLPETGRKHLLDECYRLWKYDALGGTIVRTTTFFTLGRGITFEFDEQAAEFYVKKFYKKNRLHIRLRSASDECNALGECYIWLRPKFNDVVMNGSKVLWRKGDTQVTFIPPQNISNIEVSEDDSGDVFNYQYEYLEGNRNSVIKVIPDISKYDTEDDTNDDGCIIHVKLNAGNMDPFGHSDLIPVKEWLDNYQEYLRDGVIINKLYRSPCFDIAIEDASEAEINAAIARYRNWSIGSNPVHTSREEWQILEFKGPGTGNEEARRALLLIIAAGVGFAEFMLADGSNASLASSKSQQLPVIKKFEDRQQVWSDTLMRMFQFALEIKALHGDVSDLKIQKDKEGDIENFNGIIEFPVISADKDLEVAQTNDLAMTGGYMSKSTAARRLNLNYEREIELETDDVEITAELQQKKIDAGLMPDPNQPTPDEQLKADTAKQTAQSRAGQAEARPRRDRSREPGGSRSS